VSIVERILECIVGRIWFMGQSSGVIAIGVRLDDDDASVADVNAA
jgi:hypothetical protein